MKPGFYSEIRYLTNMPKTSILGALPALKQVFGSKPWVGLT